ncbi:carboxypeptidase regulatory-like domain-containing protein [Fibrobacter sp.]|uniref:carboxypeptidase regulatory-like domain-containing protein n=1 Tax=Fibrobacter sp. TaxID=35828 RepID=UPI00388FBFEC
MNKFYLTAFAGLLFAALAWVGCSDNEVAGGVSEETNTIAGILVDKKGTPVVSAMVYCKSVDADTVTSSDETDSKGKFSLPVKRFGNYGISATVDSLAYYEVVKFMGKDVELNTATLTETADISGRVMLRDDSTSAGIVVRIPGSSWTATTDSLGFYKLEGVPAGKTTLQVVPADLTRFVRVNREINVGSLSGAKGADSVMVPLSMVYGLRSWWAFSAVGNEGPVDFVSDSRSWTAGMKLYGNPEWGGFVSYDGTSNVVGAVHFKGASQFGVVEDDRGILDSATGFAVEVVLQVDKILDTAATYRKNLVGKLGFGSEDDKNVFSLAVIKGECGMDKPSFAFFMADGSGDSLSCKNAVVSKNSLEFGKRYYLMATWNGKTVSLYENGKKVGETDVPFEKILPSEESIFVGKESLEFSLEDLRISVEPLNEADAEFRNKSHEIEIPFLGTI